MFGFSVYGFGYSDFPCFTLILLFAAVLELLCGLHGCGVLVPVMALVFTLFRCFGFVVVCV